MAHAHALAQPVETLDPYAFMAVLGKRVIHPGGRRSTEQLLQHGDFHSAQRVIDVGCGVGSTAITIARRSGASVTALDISPMMLERARANVRSAGLSSRVAVQAGDILSLPFEDGRFDRVVAEAVTMFVDRPRAARELVRVCAPGGRVLATEFFWRRPPSTEARQIFLGEVCPGMQFDSLEDWTRLYSEAGLDQIQTTTGPFQMMTLTGFLRDEGLLNTLAICGRAVGRRSYLRRMAWLMPRMARAIPYLGYILIVGVKPMRDAGQSGSA